MGPGNVCLFHRPITTLGFSELRSGPVPGAVNSSGTMTRIGTSLERFWTVGNQTFALCPDRSFETRRAGELRIPILGSETGETAAKAASPEQDVRGSERRGGGPPSSGRWTGGSSPGLGSRRAAGPPSPRRPSVLRGSHGRRSCSSAKSAALRPPGRPDRPASESDGTSCHRSGRRPSSSRRDWRWSLSQYAPSRRRRGPAPTPP